MFSVFFIAIGLVLLKISKAIFLCIFYRFLKHIVFKMGDASGKFR